MLNVGLVLKEWARVLRRAQMILDCRAATRCST